MPTDPPELTHTDAAGTARMVDVGDKPDEVRVAVAAGAVVVDPATATLVRDNGLKKGDVLAVARIAGIQAAKQTPTLIPLCHHVALSHVDIEFEVGHDRIGITCTTRTTGPTGVEMEALTGATAAALTVYDMCKAVDKGMQITGFHLVSKTKSPPPPA